ncbi:ABC transporter permease [Alkalibaculum bacchi]|uniref:ABC transporter permease n=1 Tax=Alkalibaculum bacchi TaxID=645887 RepID=UPI0026EB1317|nr:ABC transporter permease [Alkalibaculum bacchi]
MKGKFTKVSFVLPTMILFTLFFFFPLILLALKSFSGEGGFTPENYILIVTNKRYFQAMINSLMLSTIVTVTSILIGAIIAFFLARTDFKGKNLFITLITFPVSLPGVVVGFMIIILFGTTGVIPMFTKMITGEALGAIAYTITGIFFAYLYFSIPKTVMILYGAVVEFDPRLEEAARTVGANEQQAIFKVVIPTLAPVFVSAASIAFSTSMSAFGTAFTLANQFEILPILMYTEYTNYFNIEIASTMAIVVAVVSLVLNLFSRSLMEKG